MTCAGRIAQQGWLADGSETISSYVCSCNGHAYICCHCRAPRTADWWRHACARRCRYASFAGCDTPSDVCSCSEHAHTAAEASAVIAGPSSSGSAGPDEQQPPALQAGVGPGTILVCVAVALKPLIAKLYLSLCADMCLCTCSSQELRTAH